MATKSLPKQLTDRVPLHDIIPLDTPYSVQLCPTDYCNIKCVFCPFHGEVKTNDCRQNNMMSLESVKVIIDRLAEFPSKIKTLIFSGRGEPLTHKALPEMIAYAKEKDIAGEIRVTTNGFLLSPELNKRLIESGLDYMKISVPAIDEQTCFEITGAKLNLDKYIANIKNLYENKRDGMTIYCKTTDIALGAKNGASMDPEKEKLFYSLFENCCDYSFVENIVYMAKNEVTESNRNKIWIGNSAPNNIYQLKNEGSPVCERTFYHFTINSLGELYPCGDSEDPSLLMGNALDTSIVDMWNSKKYLDLRLAFLKGDIPEFCKKCSIFTFEYPNDLHKYADEISERLLKSAGKE